MLARLGLLASLGLLTSPSTGQAQVGDGDGVHISLTGPGVPYALVEHAIEARHGTVMVRVTKKFAHRFGHFDRVGLLGLDELAPLLKGWFPPGEPPLKAPQPEVGATAVLNLTWTLAGKTRHLRMAWPPEPGAVVAGERAREIQRAVEAIAGAVPYQDALLLPAESGRVRLRSRPEAWVRIDGLLLSAPTPVDEHVLPSGDHEISFTPVSGGAMRTYPLKVVHGQTTALDVDLK